MGADFVSHDNYCLMSLARNHPANEGHTKLSKPTKHILFIAHHSAPYQDHLLNRLSKNPKFSVTLVLLKRHDGKHDFGEFETFGGRIVYLDNKSLTKGRHLDLSITKHIKDNDVIFISGYHHHTTKIALLTSFFLSKKIVMMSDNSLLQYFAKNSLSKISIYCLNKILSRLVDAFWVPGQSSADYYRHFGVSNRKIFKGRYALKASEIVPPENGTLANLKNCYGINTNNFVFLSVSSLTKNRNFDVLLECMKQLQATKPGAFLIIVGDGPEKQKLTTMAGSIPNVVFAGNQRFSNLNNFFFLADAYVTLSSEPYSLSISQAALTGLPIIASNRAGASFDYFDENDKNVVAPTDVPAITAAMALLMNDQVRRAQLASRLHERAHKIDDDFAFNELRGCLNFLLLSTSPSSSNSSSDDY